MPQHRLERNWDQPHEGIWEVRGPRQHFTHSKVMAWVAFDRSVKAVQQLGVEGPVERWTALRDRIHDEVCRNAFDPALRMAGTLAAIERRLVSDGLVFRYGTGQTEDGLPPGEGAFIACSLWYADNLILAGRRADARAMFGRILVLRNDVGLLSEEYVAGKPTTHNPSPTPRASLAAQVAPDGSPVCGGPKMHLGATHRITDSLDLQVEPAPCARGDPGERRGRSHRRVPARTCKSNLEAGCRLAACERLFRLDGAYCRHWMTRSAKPCLILAPHPDDESLGWGGLIAAWRPVVRVRAKALAASYSGTLPDGWNKNTESQMRGAIQASKKPY